MKKVFILSIVAAAALAACGGSDDTPAPAATAEVPASAGASPAGFIAYLMALIASEADTLEPVDVSAVVPPTDDTSEPTPIN
jgi:ABC-type glycerol-3-phosphate transport system substrate-binding protein